MKITTLTLDQQAFGEFNAGAILERKLIGFPQDHGQLRPYGNLFYWAHAWSTTGGMIGEHPHKGFEIISFILKGTTHHYDSQLRGWKQLDAGDVQIIRAGSGISHAERVEADSAIFQIWFDPGLERTMGDPATYNDHKAHEFPITEGKHGRTTTYIGTGSPLQLRSKPVEVLRTNFTDGQHSLEVDGNLSVFILGGNVQVNGQALQTNDFFLIEGQGEYAINTSGGDLFMIYGPEQPDYKTYNQLMNRQMKQSS